MQEGRNNSDATESAADNNKGILGIFGPNLPKGKCVDEKRKKERAENLVVSFYLSKETTVHSL
ncbi:hypothetical protein G4B88_015252 [Cannabis sativa]|uniref:Uncharacterized protein n=1 Tax=Cannabis sativa TaxID=3483 RepID=A0A7J6DKX7_CANSA|nr:hypothetical protein G4B88_015252 [Cannabis sativa]